MIEANYQEKGNYFRREIEIISNSNEETLSGEIIIIMIKLKSDLQ
jgi:hypothetical protein